MWPAWEVRESGGVTSWYQVRLEFADGARVEALAVAAAGCLSVEDVRGRPALSLADLAVLADWIGGPLAEACGIELGAEGAGERVYGAHTYGSGTHGRDVHADDAYGGEADGGGGEGDEDGDEDGDRGGGTCGGTYGEGGTCGEAGARTGLLAGPRTPGGEFPEEGFPGGEFPEGGFPGGPVSRRARPAWPRGAEGRRLLAQEYRAAQEDGFDPVLAVMCATGHSRRRSLRLIAQARDAGFLTPRHIRR
ncbi:DUF6214 family protein [Streptomyces sp. NPDC093094]|uniref:DUF6214 family protein n=1 Tax=Streptomyces sp. NPDC093094 TaxID=3366026 RepID=UPI0037FAB383